MTTAAPALQDAPRSSVMQAIDRLLRDPRGLLEDATDPAEAANLARAAIVTIAIGAGCFGAAMGTARGGLQIPYAALKLPLVILLTTAVCSPALSALNSSLGRPAALRADLSLVLAALARTSFVLAAAAPLVLLAVWIGLGYHSLILLVVACCSAAAVFGLALFLQSLPGGTIRHKLLVSASLLCVFGLVGSQMAWTLRPFLQRPRDNQVHFVRSIEGSFLESLVTSSRSARGVYWRSSAPLPGEEMP